MTALPHPHQVRQHLRDTLAPTSDAGATGWSEGRTTSADMTVGATGENSTTQAGSCAKATQVDPTKRSRLPRLPTDDESETEPEDMYSQGDRLDPNKDQWEKAVGGAVCGACQVIPPRGPLVRETDCCDERAVDPSRQHQYNEPRNVQT